MHCILCRTPYPGKPRRYLTKLCGGCTTKTMMQCPPGHSLNRRGVKQKITGKTDR